VRKGAVSWNECAPIFGAVGAAALPAAPFLVGGLAHAPRDFEPPLLAVGAPAIPALVEALARGEEPALIARAAEVLGKMGTAAAAAVPALEKLLDDPDDEVRREAAKVLRQIITERADR
jgi:HEAT repeat protein